MTTTLSSKGQIVVPQAARKRLGLQPGTKFNCHVEGRSIVLTPKGIQASKPQLVRDPLTGLIVTQGPKDSPPVTSEQIRAFLSEFP